MDVLMQGRKHEIIMPRTFNEEMGAIGFPFGNTDCFLLTVTCTTSSATFCAIISSIFESISLGESALSLVDASRSL